jgi:hypothetical protein
MASTDAARLKICVVDGRANIEILPQEGADMKAEGELDDFVCLEEGQTLFVQMTVGVQDNISIQNDGTALIQPELQIEMERPMEQGKEIRFARTD